jgi:hypothetical protein
MATLMTTRQVILLESARWHYGHHKRAQKKGAITMATSNSVEHLKKQAKTLLKAYREGSERARAWVDHVYRDPIDHLGLQQAQHVVARRHNFDSWQAVVAASDIERRLAITMAKEPYLTDFGIGIFYNRSQSREERRATFQQQREQLRRSARHVEWTVDWLRQYVTPIKTINRNRTSYGWKHLAEKFYDEMYITNGVFIAAGIIADYPYKIIDGPNVPFGMSEKSAKMLRKREDEAQYPYLRIERKLTA